MWKKPKKKKVLAPVTEWLKKMREKESEHDKAIYEEALKKFKTKNVGHKTKR